MNGYIDPMYYQQQIYTPVEQRPVQPPVSRGDICQAKFMRQYNDKHREKFNDELFSRSNEEIIEDVEKVILSCQRNNYFSLKVTSFRVAMDYEEVYDILRQYEINKVKNKNKKIDNPYDYIDLRDSDIMLLIVGYHIKLNCPPEQIAIDPKTKEPELTETDLEVLIALPRFVNKYYFRISGNFYAPIFQVVDGSTYNNSTSTSKVQSVTLKTVFMPIRIYREFDLLVDACSGEEKKACLYTSIIFTKKVDAMKYILGRYGIYGTFELLGIQCIFIGKDQIKDPNTYYNFIKNDIIISVPKEIFNRDAMTQSLICTLFRGIKTDNINDIFDPRYWNRSLGGEFKSPTLEKGIPVLDSLEGIYDIKTKESIHLPMEEKQTVYHILRWMMREFPALKMKDNLDVSTKKIRISEYLACIYAMKIFPGICRVSDEGKNVKIQQIIRAINIAPNYIISKMNKSKLVNYVDLVNDNDAVTALGYSYKGISGLGDQGSGTAIPIVYRFVDTSYLGRIDPDSSSASDPGLSGTLCPMADIYGNSFSEYKEPNGWKEEYDGIMKNYLELVGKHEALAFKEKMGFPYDSIKSDMVRETLNTCNELICPIIDMNGKIDYSLAKSIPVSIKGIGETGVGDIIFNEENVE